MTLSVDISGRRGAFALEAAFESSGPLTALFGASGSGKTSLVNLIGGLLRPNQGKIVVDGRALVDTTAGIFVSRHGVGWVVGVTPAAARAYPWCKRRQSRREGLLLGRQRELRHGRRRVRQE